MNMIIRRFRGYEKGQALLLVLILLGVGSLLIAPLLDFIGTGLDAAQTFENKMGEYYAADAGVQDAIWKINNRDQVPGFPTSYNPDPPEVNYIEYSIPDVNGNLVTVFLEYINPLNGGTFRVRSYIGNTVIDNDTMIDAIIATVFGGDYGGIIDNVVTSQGVPDIHEDVEVVPSEGDHSPQGGYTGDWPTPEEIALYYWYDVYNLEPELFDTIYVEDEEYQPPPAEGLGPFFRDGTLSIINSGDAGLTLQLNGTLYITGDTVIGMTNQDFTLYLNGNTIFVESATAENQYALKIGTKCNITGSGAIIAVGNIELKPNFNCSPGDYILVMSVIGKTYMQPSGTFYGTLAGSVSVDVQPGIETHIEWTDPDGVDGGINFPGGGSEEGLHWGILTWEIS